ncbi:VanZ family protein [Bacillus suaedae]|uniref:VanZ family protein n=1 Tax=Halalkalibacter suaedae TaxID=2822140 RepID=A0A941AU05_9BACI|nr:VanZ family protein [Bacillus suaedae]MBP3953174.1 VanZ family protein [Bacillus suaedae]
MKWFNIWWAVAIGWCIAIAIATRAPFFTGQSTESLFEFPFFNAEIINFLARKMTHLVAFGMLAVFVWLALNKLGGHKLRYYIAWFVATFYGAVDEWHQSFLPERTAAATDVLIDSMGALFFLLLICSVKQHRTEKHRQSKNK